MKGTTIVGIGLIVVIIVMTVILYNQWETIFTHQVVIDYPDQCQEKYINGELVTEECDRGRILLENGSMPIWNVDPNQLVYPNLTNRS